jgi:hypothetical protein
VPLRYRHSYSPKEHSGAHCRRSPWPPRRETLTHLRVPNTVPVLVRIADQPKSIGLELAGDLRSVNAGFSRTPSPLACRARTIR